LQVLTFKFKLTSRLLIRNVQLPFAAQYRLVDNAFSPVWLNVLIVPGSKTGVFIKIEPYEDTFQTFFSILKEWIAGFKTAPEVIRNIGLSRLDLLKRGNGGRFGEEEVNAFADLWRVVPVMSTMAVYWTCFSQVKYFLHLSIQLIVDKLGIYHIKLFRN